MRLKGKNIGVVVDDGFEDLELRVTVMRLPRRMDLHPRRRSLWLSPPPDH